MPGTERGYAATRLVAQLKSPLTVEREERRGDHSVSGNCTAYALQISGTGIAYALRMSGTAIAYGAGEVRY
eukprot:1394291-Rhodomonas_salina.1